MNYVNHASNGTLRYEQEKDSDHPYIKNYN